MSKKADCVQLDGGYEFRPFHFLAISMFLGQVRGSWPGFLRVTKKLIQQEKEVLLSEDMLPACYKNIVGVEASSYEALLKDTQARIGYKKTGKLPRLSWDEQSYLDARAIFEHDYMDGYVFIGGGSLRAETPII